MTRAQKNRSVSFIAILTLLLFGAWVKFFCGVYTDDEFGQKIFFIKHRPTGKFFFHSPRSLSDIKPEDMLPKQRAEQSLYDEYVPRRKWEFPLSR